MIDSSTDARATQREQLVAEVEHWRRAARQLTDLDLVAAPEAWTRLEQYVGGALRQRLHTIAAALDREAAELSGALRRLPAPASSGDDGGAGDGERSELAMFRRRLLDLRRRYLRAETIVEFFGDAVNTRTDEGLGGVLRGLDVLATDSMQVVLRPLGLEAPPVITYVDKGLGASILRSGVRLWDRGSESPVAMIKITRHNLGYPTALLHETGHQVFHQARWVPELADALRAELLPVSAHAAETWASWASELAADVHAFALTGYAPVPALANVVDGTTRRVFTMPFGDPHPFGWIRVMFNVALCRSWYGPGPWDRLERVWMQRHRPEGADRDAVAVAKLSMPRLAALADVCTRRPMQAFGGRPLAVLADPMRVSPGALRQLADRAGSALYTSAHLQRHEPLRILAWTTLRLTGGHDDHTAAADLRAWLRRVGGDVRSTRQSPPNPQIADSGGLHTSLHTSKEQPWQARHRAA